MLSEKSRQTLISLWGISKECGQTEIQEAIAEVFVELELIGLSSEEIEESF